MATPAPRPNGQPVIDHAQIQRPARFLVGWMPEEQALHVQANQRADVRLPEHARIATNAREVVAARRAGFDQAQAILPAPPSLRAHTEALRQSLPATAYFNEGWTVALADLRKICAVQPNVFTDHTEERTAGAAASDFESLANITLPLASNANIPAQYDQVHQAYTITSPDPNLRIIGAWGGTVPPGVPCLGFKIMLAPSFLQVAKVHERYVLRDGYHRAYGLLRRGIFVVPAFVRDFGLQELGLPQGMLPQAAYLGERPPALPDYLDDSVSIDVTLPATQKMIVIHAVELTPTI